ncbi:MAG: hypothetical protein DBW65_01885 [Alphaproteobacteria bacterium]|nr:MAG: hypothetical protein DBW65_01885 [Alphaproteobacteria bacterium]
MENNIIIDKDLPLLICDADEVIFNFMDSFDEFLNVNNMYFSYETFKLNGNILQKKNNIPISSNEVPKIITNFFEHYTMKMPFIKNAKEVLKELSYRINIIILSNIPKASSLNRINYLKQNDMHYTFICNEGPKNIKCMELEKLTNKNIFFIDDLPSQIASVSNSCKNIITIHFLQNKKLIKIIPEVKDCNYKVNNWNDVKKIILKNI